MKKIITLLIIGMIATTQAAVVTYDFDAGMGDSTSGTDLSAGTIAYLAGSQSDGIPQLAERAWNPAGANNEYELNIGQRGVGNSGILDAAFEIGAAAQLTFTLTPNAGESLSFSTAGLSFDSLIYNDSSANMLFGYKVWADTGSGFNAVGALQSASYVSTAGTGNLLLQVDESSVLDGFVLTDGTVTSVNTAYSFDLSSIGAVATDQAVTFAITISGNRNNQGAWGNSIDDLVINSIVIPEPATLGMVTAIGGGLLFIRRRFII